MKYQIASLAVVALLTSSARANEILKSMISLATEDDQIAAGSSEWNDVGYIQVKGGNKDEDVEDEQNIGISSLNKQKNKMVISEKAEELRDEINEREGSDSNIKLFANIQEKLQDKSFIETAVKTSLQDHDDHDEGHVDTHTPEYEDFEPRSGDLSTVNGYGGRTTEKLGGWTKDYEDSWNEGGHNTAGTSEIKNQPQHSLPGSWDKFGPTNIPKHLNGPDFKAASGPETPSGSGEVVVYLTVDNDEHAVRFIKALFNKDLIAQANQYEGNFERTYLKLGRMATEKGRDRLELITTGDKVAALIDYVNKYNPTSYDYPVPDSISLPIKTGNIKYLGWVKKTLSENAAGLHEEAGSHDHDEEEEHHDDDDEDHH